MARKKEIDRDRILDAADQIILESGGRHFTLDAVADRAGISKGGLVYSFPTKDELIAAALDREIMRFQAGVNELVADADRTPARQILGLIERMLLEDEIVTRRAAFLFTSLAQSPEIAEPVLRFYRSLFDLFDPDTSQGRDVRQAILAVEGLFLMRGLAFIDVSKKEWNSALLHAHDTILKALAK